MKAYLEERRAMVDRGLERLLPPEGTRPPRLISAMRYSLFAGGKRIRPILVLAAAEAAGGALERAMPAACAVEMVHTYSLIHDDLPAMDDDDFRRGRPTCHRAFDEATAILAGDALLTMAFEVLCSDGSLAVPAEARLRMVRELGAAAGWKGMVGGQQADMESEGLTPDQPTLEYIHTHKTGAMIRCCAILGGLCAGAGEEAMRLLTRYGEAVGLSFQIVDDILDETATTDQMGKDAGSDAARGKMTYPALLGLEGARARAAELVREAMAAGDAVDGSGRLSGLADYILTRRL